MGLALPREELQEYQADKIYCDLTWKRLEQVLCFHAVSTAHRVATQHLLAAAQANAARWTEAALCLELMSIIAIALEPQKESCRCCGRRPIDCSTGATMT